MRKTPFIVGIAGGTGSGKTMIAEAVTNAIGKRRVAYVQQDSYYKDRSNIPSEERRNINYDHPDALDNELLIRHLQELRDGHPIDEPIYDFRTHTRKSEIQTIYPKDVIIVEGVLVLADKRLRDLMDTKLFVDTDADVRFIRRLQRDLAERGRTVESIIDQYLNTVRPMHSKFVEPSKKYTDLVIPGRGYGKTVTDRVVPMIRAALKESK